MEKHSSCLYERKYCEVKKQGQFWNLDAYWQILLGQDVYEKVRKNYGNFEFYLSQNTYEKWDKKDIEKLIEFIMRFNNTNTNYSFENRNEKIYFEGFYKVLVEYGKSKLIERIEKVVLTEESLVEFEIQLLKRLQEICLRTLIVQMHNFQQNGQLKGKNETEKYNYFCERIIIKKEFLIKVFEEYPVLGRCTVKAIRNFVNYYAEIVMYAQKDRKLPVYFK